jgi:hypothetical protein
MYANGAGWTELERQPACSLASKSQMSFAQAGGKSPNCPLAPTGRRLHVEFEQVFFSSSFSLLTVHMKMDVLMTTGWAAR